MRFWMGCMIVLLLGAGFVPPAAAQEFLASFTEVNCARSDITPPASNVTVTCGTVDVPENYAYPDGDTLALYVAIFHTEGTTTAEDPVIYLHGGPGDSSIYAVWRGWTSYSAFAVDRDLVVFDLRGTGLSEPRIECDELYDIRTYTLDEWVTQMNACHSRLAQEGHDLTTFTSAVFAQDMDMVRQALGYNKWNVLGISYGTRLALTAMRDTPDAIRSVILDSVYPVDINLYEYRAWSADRAFSALFDACRQEEACNNAYPNLEEEFYALVERLNHIHTPERYTNANQVLQGDGLVRALFQALYRTSYIPSLPRILDELTQGVSPDYALIDLQLSGSLSYAATDTPIRYLLECAEELPFHDQALVPSMSGNDAIRRFASGTSDDMFALCPFWAVDEPPSAERLPVESEIPVFIMTGEFDPITPPQWGLKVARHLPNSTFAMFSRAGHGVSLDRGCPRMLAVTFFDDPDAALDTACAQEHATFAVPRGIQLEPFVNESDMVEGVRPVGWLENPDFEWNYYPEYNPFTNLAQLTYANYNLESSKAYLEDFYGIRFEDEANSTFESEWLNWDVYAVDDLAMYFAFAENGPDTHVVTLYTSVPEFRINRKTLLYPVLEAFHPFNLD